MDESKENYLISIFRLWEKFEDKKSGVKVSELAKELNISKPSVSEMVRQLAKEKLIIAKPYKPIFLTKKGEKKASWLMHKHRVIEVFLKEILNYDLENAHHEAHKLEHAFSDESIKRLDNFLNNPKKSPFGKKIP